MTHSRKHIVELLDAHGIRPSKALGQNYVADANTVRRIARMAEIAEGDHVVEVGAGLGSLTLALVECGARVTAIEIDKYVASSSAFLATTPMSGPPLASSPPHP